jgi:hypothetical protein
MAYDDELILAATDETVEQRDAREARQRAKEWIGDATFRAFLEGLGFKRAQLGLLPVTAVNYLAATWHGYATLGEAQAAERQADADHAAERDRQAQAEDAKRDASARERAAEADRTARREQAERDRWAVIVTDTGDPARALVAWLRTMPDVRLKIRDAATLAALQAAGTQLTADVAARQREIAIATAQFQAERLVRLATGQPAVAIPEPLDVAALWSTDDVARWLVVHAGTYTLDVGRWVNYEKRAEDGTVTETVRRLVRPAGWLEIERACERWATWHRIMADVATHPAEAERLQRLGLDVLRGDPQYEELVSEEHGAWSFEPEDSEADGSDAPPATVAKPGPRPLAEDELDDRIVTRAGVFFRTFKRWPATNEELANYVRGARRERVVARIKVLLMEGRLVARDGGVAADH